MDPLIVLGEHLPSWAMWLARIPDQVRAGHRDRARQALADLTPHEIEVAVRAISRWDSMPKMDCLPWEVARLAMRRRERTTKRSIERTVGMETYRCLACEDTGLVEIYDRETIREYKQGGVPQSSGGRLVEYYAVAACTCETGERVKEHCPYLATYSPAQDVRVVWGRAVGGGLDRDWDYYRGRIGAPPRPVVDMSRPVSDLLREYLEQIGRGVT